MLLRLVPLLFASPLVLSSFLFRPDAKGFERDQIDLKASLARDQEATLASAPAVGGDQLHAVGRTSAYEAYLDQFSQTSPDNSLQLAEIIRDAHPNASVVFTQSPYFQLGQFAYFGGNEAKLRVVPGAKSFHRKAFLPAARRRDGPGVVYDEPLWQEYELDWRGVQFCIIQTTWNEGWSSVTQHAIVGGTQEDADLLILAVSSFVSSVSDVVWVFDGGFWQPDRDLYESVQKADWADIILDSELKTQIQKEYKSFFKSEAIYKDLGVAWKRGLILLGPPGNGKTISIKAIMKSAGVPALYVKSFHSWQGDENGIKAIFNRARAEAPCVLIMEDLDSLINDQNRAFFLNELDGIEDNDGLLLIASTNHFDRLDPALSNRPSRFDRKYNFPDPVLAERRQYAVYWQNKLKPNTNIDFPHSLLDKVAEATSRFSFAYLKEAFVSALITIAGDETDHLPAFETVLMQQIKWLRDQIGTDKGTGLPSPDQQRAMTLEIERKKATICMSQGDRVERVDGRLQVTKEQLNSVKQWEEHMEQMAFLRWQEEAAGNGQLMTPRRAGAVTHAAN